MSYLHPRVALLPLCTERLNELLVGSDGLNGVLFSFRADLKFRHDLYVLSFHYVVFVLHFLSNVTGTMPSSVVTDAWQHASLMVRSTIGTS